ncbi:MAG: hypothetical protein LC117_07030 [Bacteroidia bacterium]|nr:hypothetical protein [Bacteroidia bacterium]MCZ2277664.1 hypothetical protein [Bacteroidia bacterium]
MNDKFKLYRLVLLTGLLFTPAIVYAQLVTGKFDRMVMSENFDTINNYWTTSANSDNLFLVQEGEYILNRKSINSPFAIIADYTNNLQDFRLVTSLILEKAVNENSSLGIIIMAQPGGDGGFVIEINTTRQYRVRQITGNTYKYLTGDSKKGGWTTSKDLNMVNSYNLIDVRVQNRNYDLYINNIYLMSFSEIAYKTGNIGFIIGPGSKGRIDFLYLFTMNDQKSASTDTVTTTDEKVISQVTPDMIELAESIIKLKTQINKLSDENQDLRKTIEVMQTEQDDKAILKKDFEKTIKSYQLAAARQQFSFDSLLKVNQTLIKYKEMVAGNENSDLIISLSKSLKAEKELNQKLKTENKVLTDSLKQQKGTTPAKSSASESPGEKKSPENFSLPVEN